jgi:hypothetical protein
MQYNWQVCIKITGDDPIGELFSPGFDCSKILDSNPEAKDGMYWIHLGGYYPKQVRNIFKFLELHVKLFDIYRA